MSLLVQATSRSVVPTALGGVFSAHRRSENAVSRGKTAAVRTHLPSREDDGADDERSLLSRAGGRHRDPQSDWEKGQRYLLSIEVDNADAAEKAVLEKAETMKKEVLATVAAEVDAEYNNNTNLVQTEASVAQTNMAAVQSLVEKELESSKASLEEEKAKADKAALHREALRAEIWNLRQTIATNYCPPPASPVWAPYSVKLGGNMSSFSEMTGCPPGADATDASGCLNGNKGYKSFTDAWVKCGETKGCGRIAKYQLNGKYYLRRRSDLAGLALDKNATGLPPFVATNYVCMAVCPTACQFPDCGHCATGLYKDGPGVARCTRPKRDVPTDPYVNASGSCEPGLIDCRSCVLDDMKTYEDVLGMAPVT
eukprot:TRINITY_DN28736_c0_g1_i2.p1 TRINITY_DN28736_c0_g1~~TRINITY_DN28736_c0_g1_i2.p1  ORF type:complete len:369 (+),score=96.97 TRINITY_DN28736_c0_g1_i2:138-1244(+)